ncbi:MAG: hypothetical protein ISP90_12125 [Nevskia sp.]|nr:hypothetical protein [Nevskia sp.]
MSTCGSNKDIQHNIIARKEEQTLYGAFMAALKDFNEQAKTLHDNFFKQDCPAYGEKLKCTYKVVVNDGKAVITSADFTEIPATKTAAAKWKCVLNGRFENAEFDCKASPPPPDKMVAGKEIEKDGWIFVVKKECIDGTIHYVKHAHPKNDADKDVVVEDTDTGEPCPKEDKDKDKKK